MNNRFSQILVVIWIIIGAACLFLGIRSLLRDEGNQYIVFFIMSAVSFGFALYRHRIRKGD